MKHATASRTAAWLPALALALMTALPASAETRFSIFRTCGPDGGGDSAGPIAMGATCEGLYGVGTSFGFAGYGALGVDATALHLAENSVPTGSGVTATFSTEVVFTSSDPSVQFVTAALNLQYAASITGVAGVNYLGWEGSWSGTASASVAFGGQFSLLHTNGNSEPLQRTFISGLQVVDGTLSPQGGILNLKTPVVGPFAVDTPIVLVLSLGANAGATGQPGSSAHSDADNTFEIPFNTNVFDLPAGVTANAGDWLVNNRRVQAVPEPETYALMALGLALVAYGARRRRQAGGSAH